MYVVVVIETESDTPGIAAVFGPFDTDAEARVAQQVTREGVADPELVQVALVEQAA